MHELALTETVVEAVRERTGDRRVFRVRLAVGRLMAVAQDALQFCFDVCTKDTPLEGAKLEIEERPARFRCRSCDRVIETRDLLPICDCKSTQLEVIAGNQLQIVEVEVQ